MDKPAAGAAPTTGASAPPETVALSGPQKERVLAQVRRQTGGCIGCGNPGLRVGDALHLGFLFLSEPADAWMVGLTCTDPACPTPHSGIKVHASVLTAG
jgi:hypothetical protein